MKLFDLLTEKRKNPELNIKKNEYEQFKDIRDQYGSDNIYVRYVEDRKLGINPQSEYKTPFGICAYPLQYVLDNDGYVPFASGRKFIIIFKVSPDASLWVLDKPVTEELINNAEQSIADVLKVKKPTFDDISDSMDLWYAIYDSINKKVGYENIKLIGLTAARVLKKMGFDGAVDNGEGIIHINEPTQAVFFSTTKLTQISTIQRTKSLNKIPRKLRKEPNGRLKSKTQSIFSKYKRDYPDLSNDELVKKFPFIVPSMKNKSDEYLKIYFNWATNNLEQYSTHLPNILPLPIEYQIKIVQNEPSKVKLLNSIYQENIDERVQLAAVQREPWVISDISAPSSKVKMAAIKAHETKYKDPDGVRKFIKIMFNGQYDKQIVDYLQKLPK